MCVQPRRLVANSASQIIVKKHRSRKPLKQITPEATYITGRVRRSSWDCMLLALQPVEVIKSQMLLRLVKKRAETRCRFSTTWKASCR